MKPQLQATLLVHSEFQFLLFIFIHLHKAPASSFSSFQVLAHCSLFDYEAPTPSYAFSSF